jgi:hypothetical protein
LAAAILIPIVLAIGVVWTGGMGGCSSGPGGPTITGGNPAAPPAPPAELPSFLIIPESVAIPVTTIGGSGGEIAALVMEGDNIGQFITSLARNAQQSFDLVDGLLAPLHQLMIPVGTNVNTFQDILFVEEDLLEVKIDFADFDEDGNGVKEGCSGHTAALPICFRIWLDGKRHLEGVFDHFPTEENAGSGRFRGVPEIDFFRKGGGAFLLAVFYDHHDSASSKSTEIFVGFTEGPSGEPPIIPENDSEFERTIHADISQIGPDESATKLVNASVDDQPASTDDTTKRRQLGRWREGEDRFSGSTKGRLTDDPLEPVQDFSAACAVISSGLVINREKCLDSGIDVGVVGVDPGAIDFVDFLTLSDVVPFNFPESPTF